MKLARNSSPSATGTPSRDGPKLLVIAALVTTLAAGLAARRYLSPDAWLPAVATVLFVFAAAAALASWLSHARTAARPGWLDLAGIFTCIGIILSLMIDPDVLMPFVEGTARRE